ncbi:MAG TPA: EAL domain-containing protein [Solirubrobacteraceae bacterium]|nr:EAL domain-containing protein [Solirubrobacteraceae bacterium]
MTAQTATEPKPKARARLARVLRRARGIHPVWGLNLALIITATALYLGPVHGLQPLAHPHLPWWAIAVAFAIAERCVVHLHFRRGAHSFSLGDIPLVFGVIFCSAESFVLGCLLGCGLVLLFDRRLPPVKFVFNIGQLAVHACIAILIVHLLTLGPGTVDTRTWVSALIATQVSALLGSSLILAAISLSEGLVKLRTIVHMLSMDLVVTTSNASLGLCGAVIAAEDAHALPLLLVPAATLFAAYRAYLSERERHKRLEFLYEANRTLARSREIAPALEGLLLRSLEAFRAEIAEIILFGSEENPSLRTLLGPGSYRELMEPVDCDVADEMREMLERTGGAITLDTPFGGGRLQRYLEARAVSHAIIAPLPGEERVIGAIMLANRFGVVRSFDHDDLRLLDTLAGNASVALQYDRLEQAVMQLSVLQEQLHHQAYHDPLTGLANRSLFTDKVRETIASRRGELAVLFIDLDDFKTVNDSLGHAAGDELLVSVASRLRSSLRPEDLVARLGGDEFAVMVEDPHDAEAAAVKVARRIMEAFVLPVGVGSESVAVYVSVGIATSHGGDFSAEEMIRDADVAMYKAKTSGKGHFQVFHPSMGAAVLERHGLKEELRLAIERQELTLYFQPIVDIDTERLVAEEALVRWEHPRRGLVGPSEFVPLAEETGLILSLGQYVLEEACQQACRWQARAAADPTGATEVAVHVNLSAVELRDPELVDRVRRTLSEAQVDPRSLVFEITETVLLDDSERVSVAIGELRALGVRFALDDFGTGYSSLSYLHTLPFDMLKIAKSFVDGLARGGREASFVRMIIELARTLGVTVIAEGIETQEQVDALVMLECDLGQGFHLGRPEPVRAELTLRPAA